ncbi:hypothetical protein GGF39_002811 [Coemansia sp. RSA 1721]|nr:hypothetical protein GGF39_002811 [Coemansia sp. RSA 1721]
MKYSAFVAIIALVASAAVVCADPDHHANPVAQEQQQQQQQQGGGAENWRWRMCNLRCRSHWNYWHCMRRCL